MANFKINDTILKPFIFSTAIDYYNTKMIYLGMKDTSIQERNIKGHFFKEIITLGNECYALSCYDANFLTPILQIQFSDYSLNKCLKVFVNNYSPHREVKRNASEKIPKRFQLTNREKRIIRKASPFNYN